MRVEVNVFQKNKDCRFYDKEEYFIPDYIIKSAENDRRLTYESRKWLENELANRSNEFSYICLDSGVIGYPLMVY